ncbi:MAG: polyisoprenoid-binding protein [Candidatus Latescibacteria bacterium]|nr:polyisoprenoid-binding protein [Candidatus Latescibacterota bacterium]
MTHITRLLGAGLAVALFGVLPAQAETYQIDAGHSALDFGIRHLVGRTKGKFKEFTGAITYDEKAVEKSSVEAVIKVSSIDTENEKRDGHLKSPDFFDAEKYPEITFKSTKVEKGEDGKLLVTGDLTLHGVTKSVQLPVEILGTGTNPWTNLPMIGFSTSLVVKRSEFGVNSWADNTGVLGDEVAVGISVEASVAPPEKK